MTIIYQVIEYIRIVLCSFVKFRVSFYVPVRDLGELVRV
jgi:hypothetical protein